jgi:hypothetical protein
MIISPPISPSKPIITSPILKAGVSPQPQALVLSAPPRDTVCFSGQNDQPHALGSPLWHSEDSFQSEAEMFPELIFSSPDFPSTEQALENLQPVLKKLSQVTLAKPFLGEPAWQMSSSPFRPAHLADFIKTHPNFKDKVEFESRSFQHKLEQLSDFIIKIHSMPEVRELDQTNRYARQYLTALSTRHAASQLMQQDLITSSPDEYTTVLKQLESGLVHATQNAKNDPYLKTEEKILKAIEKKDADVKSLQKVVELYQNRHLFAYLSPEALEPDLGARPIIQSAQKDLQALVRLSSSAEKAAFEEKMQGKAQDFDHQLAVQEQKQSGLLQLYKDLSSYLRSRVMGGFSKPQPLFHPLSDTPEFQALWNEVGGDKAQLKPMPRPSKRSKKS